MFLQYVYNPSLLDANDFTEVIIFLAELKKFDIAFTRHIDQSIILLELNIKIFVMCL